MPRKKKQVMFCVQLEYETGSGKRKSAKWFKGVLFNRILGLTDILYVHYRIKKLEFSQYDVPPLTVKKINK